MKIDIPVYFNHADAVSNVLRYARIDNTSVPAFQTITGVITSPHVVQNVDNGQYRIGMTPVYADGRVCGETTTETDVCPLILALNASQVGNNIVVTYTAGDAIPQVRVTVSYPNGGSFTQNYTNGNAITIPLPSGVYGNYTVSMQSVCDPDTNFYSSPSAPVNVLVAPPYTVDVTSSAPGITITEILGITGFTQSASVIPGVHLQGTHDAFTGVIYFTVTGTPAINVHATLYVNGVQADCLNIPSATTYGFDSATYLETDVINISFSTGNC